MYFKNTATIVFLVAGIVSGCAALVAHAGTLSCTVATSCAAGTIIYKMQSTTNAHAELASQSNYAQFVCCTGVTGLGTSCSGTFATSVKLSGTTNAHAEEGTQTNYGSSACMSVPFGGSASIGYQSTNCTGFDTTLGSISGTTNAHVGDTTAYTTKICGTAVGAPPQSLSFNISDNTIGFGTLVSGGARYGTGDTLGASADSADAHTITVSTNAASGYTMAISGTTLTCAACGGATVTAIGATAVASSPGTEQFGERLIVNSGSGTASAPYNGANWALDTAAFPDTVATGPGDGVATDFGVRYVANIAANTETGSYSGVLTYTVTATF